jgi:type II secretory pathway component PulF
METQQPAAEFWILPVVLVGLPICFFLFFKSFRAQTRKAYWTYNALIGAVMLVMFGLMRLAGLIPSTEQLREHQAKAPPPQEVLSNLPTSFLVLVGLVGLIWIGGGNWIVIHQRRKAGRSWWDCFNPFNPPFRDMNRKAWLQVALLAVFSLVVFSVGLNLIHGAAPAASGGLAPN